MYKRLNLYRLFLDEKEKTKLSREESAEIWNYLEAFLDDLKRTDPALPGDEKEGYRYGR